jgi:predicted TIM-barrel fold metal-dependent hydrolase
VPENSLLDAARQPNQDWIKLVSEFPDRFVVGTDYFHQGTERGTGQVLPPPTPAIRRFVDALPPQLVSRVAHENAARIYRTGLT